MQDRGGWNYKTIRRFRGSVRPVGASRFAGKIWESSPLVRSELDSVAFAFIGVCQEERVDG